jgi:tetratricopeptide (TPR) repeat protein
MERIEEWSMQLRKELEKVAELLQKSHPKYLLGDVGQPELEKKTNTLSDQAMRIFHKIEKGFRKIVESLPEMFETYKDPSSKDVIQAIGQMIMTATVLVKNPGPVLLRIAQGERIQDLLGVTEQVLASMYMAAKYLYDHQQYEEAASAFCLLSLLSPSCPSFWQGLGNSEYFLGRYQEALIAYNCATLMDPEEPLPHILSAKCHIALEQYPAAKLALSLAESTQDKHKPFKEQINRLQEELRRFL